MAESDADYSTGRSGRRLDPDCLEPVDEPSPDAATAAGQGRIGALARPEEILFSADLPKTRSGKIMRRLLRDIAEGKTLGDTTTLADPSVIEALKKKYEDKEG